MKRILGIALLSVLSLASPAYADHGGYEDGDCRGGGCGTERDEQYGNGSCKYVCPAFDRSPVEDSFNICLPGATCYWDGQKDREQPEEQQPS